jgi:nitrate reductase gamma subunit
MEYLPAISIFLTYIAIFTLLAVTVFRTVKIAKLPMHLRWELAPVPGEKGKDKYGGSYLEDYEWWTGKREKSIFNEALYMLKEIFFLKAVWENNKGLWIFSMPFHWGLYFFIIMILVLIFNALAGFNLKFAILVLAYLSYLLGTFGSLGLLVKRIADPDLRDFSTVSNYLNLIFLAAMFSIGGFSLLYYNNFPKLMQEFFRDMINFSWYFDLPLPVFFHIIVTMLFAIYLPFTYMIHFVAKYFTYHSVKWNDEPMNDKMAGNVNRLLNQPISWSAVHIEGASGKTWVDAATADMKEEKK